VRWCTISAVSSSSRRARWSEGLGTCGGQYAVHSPQLLTGSGCPRPERLAVLFAFR
jgi:hypothetical protein